MKTKELFSLMVYLIVVVFIAISITSCSGSRSKERALRIKKEKRVSFVTGSKEALKQADWYADGHIEGTKFIINDSMTITSRDWEHGDEDIIYELYINGVKYHIDDIYTFQSTHKNNEEIVDYIKYGYFKLKQNRVFGFN